MNINVMPLERRANEKPVQRQHPRFKLPIRIRINGRTYPSADWSVAGVDILEVDFFPEPEAPIEVEMVFPLRDSSVSVALHAVVRSYDRAARRCGVQFVDVTEQQSAMLQFVVDEYLCGRITEAAGVLEFASREATAKARGEAKADQSEPGRARMKDIISRTLGIGFAAIVGLASLGFIAYSIYGQLFVVEAISAQIAVPSLDAESPVSGIVKSLSVENAAPIGAPLFEVTDNSGATASVMSPCDCVVIGRPASVGNFVEAGAPVVVLAAADARPFVKARLPFADLGRIYRGATVSMTFLDGRQEKVGSAAIQFPSLVGRAGNVLEIDIPAGRKLAVAAAGQPVAVEFSTFDWPFFN